ncbi:SPW repeat protein [Pengzhenrongella sp.]|jgi:hypothetical protein|uniref:SPW repeat protein n=1 Tax=Pengzhenrongella sp. TaxID=2888820 RepID=UPI002F91E4E5
MRKAHPQDYVALLAGVYAALSPLWTETTSKATVTMVSLGVITAVVALVSLFRPDLIALEGLMALLGVLFVIAPWVMGFADIRAMAVTAWIVGVVSLVIGLGDVRVTRTHRGIATSH